MRKKSKILFFFTNSGIFLHILFSFLLYLNVMRVNVFFFSSMNIKETQTAISASMRSGFILKKETFIASIGSFYIR